MTNATIKYVSFILLALDIWNEIVLSKILAYFVWLIYYMNSEIQSFTAIK